MNYYTTYLSIIIITTTIIGDTIVTLQKDKKVLSILVNNSISIITNYCLYIISRDSSNSNTKGYCLNLPKISSVQDCSKLFSRSTRINIRYNKIISLTSSSSTRY